MSSSKTIVFLFQDTILAFIQEVLTNIKDHTGQDVIMT